MQKEFSYAEKARMLGDVWHALHRLNAWEARTCGEVDPDLEAAEKGLAGLWDALDVMVDMEKREE
jgi:hypothetical protein